MHASSVGQAALGIAKGPGFDPQAPLFFNIIFLCIIPCAGFQDIHHTSSMISQPDVQQAKSNAWHVMVYHRPSQTCNIEAERSTWTKAFGLRNCYGYPLNC